MKGQIRRTAILMSLALLTSMFFIPAPASAEIWTDWDETHSYNWTAQNKNNWILNEAFTPNKTTFSIIAIKFTSLTPPPANVAELAITDVMNKTVVNITTDSTEPNTWHIIYLGDMIELLGENHRLKVSIKAHMDTPDSDENTMTRGGTRAVLDTDIDFKVGSIVSTDPPSEAAAPEASGGGGGGGWTVEIIPPTDGAPSEDGPEIHWSLAFISGFFVMLALADVKVAPNVDKKLWLIIALIFFLASLGVFG